VSRVGLGLDLELGWVELDLDLDLSWVLLGLGWDFGSLVYLVGGE
jgi:hypothetical protein